MLVVQSFAGATTKIPAKCVLDECVLTVTTMKITHSYDLVIIAAKACVKLVENTAYVANVVLFIALYVKMMMEWMLLPIVKVTVVKMDPFVLHAECLKSTMIVGGVKICCIPSSLGRGGCLQKRMEGLLGRRVNFTKRLLDFAKRTMNCGRRLRWS